MFISITFTETSIDETNKTQQKVKGSKFVFKMSTIHANTCIQISNDYTTVQSLPWWWCGPAASTRSADVLSTPSHHGSANGRPSLEGYPKCKVHRIQIWRTGWPHLWRDKIWIHMDRSTIGHAPEACPTVDPLVRAMWIDPPLDAMERSTQNKNGRLSPANRLPTDKTNTQGLNFTFHLLTSNKSTYSILFTSTIVY